MTLTPSRAVSIFGPRSKTPSKHGDQGEKRSPPLVDLRDRRRAADRLAVAPRFLAPEFWGLPAWRRGGTPNSPRPRGRILCRNGLYWAATSPRARSAGAALGWFLIRPVNAVLGWFFRGFNRLFDGVTAAYGWTVGKLLRLSVIVLVVYGGLLGLTWWRVASAPTGFIPMQDQGYLLVNVQLPDSASVQRTDAILAKIDKIARRVPGVAHTVGVSGEAFLTTTNGPNLGTMFVGLKPFEQRTRAEYDAVIAAKIQQQCNQEIEGAIISVFRRRPSRAWATPGASSYRRSSAATWISTGLQTMTDQLVQRARTDPHYAVVFTLYRAHTPQLFVDIDRAKVQIAPGADPGRLYRPPGLHGRVLRQSVQQVRPHLAGQHPGRPRIRVPVPTSSSSSMSAPPPVRARAR